MLSKLQKFFDRYLSESAVTDNSIAHRLQLAAAALLVEMIQVDEKVTTQEKVKIRDLLKARFELDSDEIEALLELAQNEKHEATDYYAFTSLINTHYSQQQKITLVEDLWRLAYADKVLDKYEEHLVRRLAELLHVPHHDFIRSKHKVLKAESQDND